MVAHQLCHTATFLTSAALFSQAPPDEGFEVAFAGRSNAGKSSVINALCAQNSLCRTSKTPGRTQLLNFFKLDANRRLVDLPGYGYAKVPGAIQDNWQDSMTAYLNDRNCLKGLVLLMDIRHPLTNYDLNLLNWNYARRLPIYVVLTKSDKLNRGPALSQLHQVQKQLQNYRDIVGVQVFSALKHQGSEQVYQILNQWLNLIERVII